MDYLIISYMCLLFFLFNSKSQNFILNNQTKELEIIDIDEILINSDINYTFYNKILKFNKNVFQNKKEISFILNNCTVIIENIEIYQPFYFISINNTNFYINNVTFHDIIFENEFITTLTENDENDENLTVNIQNTQFKDSLLLKPFVSMASKVNIDHVYYENISTFYPFIEANNIIIKSIQIEKSSFYSFIKSNGNTNLTDINIKESSFSHTFLNHRKDQLFIKNLYASQIRLNSLFIKLKNLTSFIFKDNQFDMISGNIEFDSKLSYSSIFSIKYCDNIVITNTSFNKIHSMCFILNNNKDCMIQNCSFNIFYNHIMYACESQSITYFKCFFSDIQSFTRSPLSISSYTKLIINNCTFLNCKSQTDGGIISSKENSEIKLIHIICKYCSSDRKGGLIYLENSHFQADSCTFHFHKAKIGPCLYLVNPLSLNIRRTEVKRHYGKYSFLYVTFTESQNDEHFKCNIDSVRIDDSYEQAIFIDGNINSTEFVNLNNAYFRCSSKCVPQFIHSTSKEGKFNKDKNKILNSNDLEDKKEVKFTRREEIPLTKRSNLLNYCLLILLIIFVWDLFKHSKFSIYFNKYKKKKGKYEV